ncbi:putative alcohol dehydrogenase [Pseudovirgaria hyperparasitica]|uniref:Alcohol dehydrogenase n=1 Tax=Pseudovirgaria hyperparasitica TaxID=470096 RepID=A0A6A6WJX9_9PEZI|nr:putative alcohol dehydrogenase [Pseudovirgaria hyperparasitica]KAF2761891.1 putative alcohol dehydrogenase [Pseudovirgaria hyperparasitica]
MSQYTVPCKGIVAYSEHDWKFEDLLTREPHEDEFMVEMIATGVCHTDISGYGGIYPRVLGHEGAGRILRLGSKSLEKNFKPGDLVILSAASCQSCHYCTTGHPAYCTSHAAVTLHANDPNFVLAADPSRVIGGGYFGQSSFASPTPVKATCAANVSALVRNAHDLIAYAPLGCGIMTGAGAITHVARCTPSDVLAVVGLGGVGLAAICAAKHLGVQTIIAADLVPARVELARTLGATHGLHSAPAELEARGTDLQGAIRALTPGGRGATHVLDTSPSVVVLGACLEAVANNGTVLQVGVKPVGARLELDTLAHMVHGRRLVGVIEGDRDPVEALPELVRWCKEGFLPVEKLLRNYPVGEFAAAREAMEKGEVIKGVLVW